MPIITVLELFKAKDAKEIYFNAKDAKDARDNDAKDK